MSGVKKHESMLDRRYGPKHVVEMFEDGNWVPYPRDRKDRDEESAKRLLERLRAKHPKLQLRLAPRGR